MYMCVCSCVYILCSFMRVYMGVSFMRVYFVFIHAYVYLCSFMRMYICVSFMRVYMCKDRQVNGGSRKVDYTRMWEEEV